MDLNITKFVNYNQHQMERFSDSVFNSGLKNIGQITWRNAVEEMSDESDWLCADLTELRDHFAEYGAWEREELDGMSGRELNALLVQFVAGEYQELADGESEGGRLYNARDGQFFYYIGV